MIDVKYNGNHKWLLGDELFEIFDNIEKDTLEITHYGHTECCLRVVSSTSDSVSIGVNADDKIVVYNPRKRVCWEHCK
jgi:hypothetical protein